MNIWDLAVDHARKVEIENKKKQDSTLLIIGSKNSGKTTLSYKFVEKNDVPKPSVGLEYSFARRSKGLDMDKEVCHIWELAGGTIYEDLLQIPITEKNLQTLTVVLVLDLSTVEELWFTMDILIKAVKKRINQIFNNSPETRTAVKENVKRFISDKPMEKLLDPFPVTLVIVVSKYDLFQEIESEKRKLICKCLRYVNLINGASLIFVSHRTENLMNKARVLLSHIIFDTTASKTIQVDYNKPLHIPFYCDSSASIGNLPDPHRSSSSSIIVESLEDVKKCFVSFFPQIESKNVVPDDPASDPNFKEPEIDKLRAEKDRELEELLKHKRENKKIWE